MKERVLKLLKAQQEGYVSGEGLSEALSVTRAAIWKSIKQLRKEGYAIDAIPSKGYRLRDVTQVFNQNEIENAFDGSHFIQEVRYFQELSSTNDYSKAEGMTFKSPCALVVADHQTKGRGRLGRQWDSPSLSGLWMSLVLKPSFEPTHAAKLTQVAALAVSKAIEETTGLQNNIKWPNDIVIGSKKVCGILTEMSAELSGIHFVVIGIGVNVNTPGFEGELAEIATSLCLESGQMVDRLTLLKSIVCHFEEHYVRFLETLNLSAFRTELITRSSLIGQKVAVERAQERFEAMALDIDEEGNLIVEYNGVKNKINYGEVTRLRKR